MEPSGITDKKWFIFLVTGAAALAFFLIYLWYGFGGHFVLQTIDYVVQNLASRSGVSVFLVRGIVIIGSIPFFWAVAKYTHGIFFLHSVRPSLRLYRSPYGMIIVAYVGLFFVAMYFASREAMFYKWCAETPEGIQTFDSAAIDPVYGIAAKPCTIEEIETVRHAGPQIVRIEDPRHFEFFDPITGKPRVWYSAIRRNISLF